MSQDLHFAYRNLARKVLTQNPMFVIGQLSPNDFDHVTDIGASVMKTRDGIQNGGSFVQSIVDNDLHQALNRADATCIRALKYFSYLYNYSRINQD